MKILIVIVAAGLGVAAATLAHFTARDPQPEPLVAAFTGAEQPGQQIAALQDTLTGALAELQTLSADARKIRQSQQDLASRYDELQTDVARMRQSNAVKRAPLSDDLDSSTDGAAEDRGVRDDLAVDDPAARANRLAAMEGAMYSQPADPGWDDAAAAQVSSTFQQLAPEGSRLLSANCNGGICRAELHFDAQEALDGMLDDGQPLFPWSHKGRMETTTQASGELTAVMYATRDGEEFPAGF